MFIAQDKSNSSLLLQLRVPEFFVLTEFIHKQASKQASKQAVII